MQALDNFLSWGFGGLLAVFKTLYFFETIAKGKELYCKDLVSFDSFVGESKQGSFSYEVLVKVQHIPDVETVPGWSPY